MTDRTAIWNEAMEEAARLADQSAACYGAHGSLCADREFVGAKAASLELAAAIRARKIGEG